MATATRIVEGARISSLIGEGNIVTEPFIVADAVGATPVERLYDAINATNLPEIGSEHPTIPFAVLAEIRGDPAGAGSDKAFVTAIYKGPEIITAEPNPTTDPGTLYDSVALQDIETRFDRAGEQILLTKVELSETITQPGVASLQIPVVIRGVQRREVANPSSLAAQYVGKVNSTPLWGEDARRWLCTRIDGTSTDFGDSYTVNYEFQRSELLRYSPSPTDTYSSWDALLVFEDEDGRPIENPVFGESMQIIQVYGEEDFDQLGLPT